MNKKIIVGIVLLLVILALLGGGYWWMKKGQAPATPQPQTTVPAVQNATPQTVEGTIQSLLSSGRSVQCTFNSATTSAQVKGTIYVSGGKMRGDFEVVTKAVTVISHLINDSQFMYIWNDATKQGIKIANTTGQTQSKTPTSSQGPDMTKSYTYSCQDWSADSSLFVLPSAVTFMDVSVPAVKPTTATGSSQTTPTVNPYCSYCTGLPAGAAKTACLTQYSCQ